MCYHLYFSTEPSVALSSPRFTLVGMRCTLAALGLLSLFLAACGDARSAAPILSNLAAPEVQTRVARAAFKVFGKVDQDDRSNGVVLVHATGFWSGNTDVLAFITAKDGQTRVEVQAKDAGANRPLWDKAGSDVRELEQAIRTELEAQ